MNYKICTKCGKSFEATIENFHKDVSLKCGLTSWCKNCRKFSHYLWKDRNKKYRNEYSKLWRSKNPDYQKQWYENNKNLYKIYRDTYRKKNKLSHNIARVIHHSLKRNKNGLHWEILVDYTLLELKLHLENQFKDDMSWDNYGKWHIDHIRPIVSFNIIGYDCDDFKECWSLKNLQPLWASDNISKGAKYMEVIK